MQDNKEKDMVLYHGYRVYRDGRVLSQRGKELKSYYFTYPNSHISLTIEGKVVKKNKALLVYNLFSDVPADTALNVLRFKDGDTANAAYDNLYLVSRKEHYRECKEQGRSSNRFDEKTKKKIRKEYYEKNMSLRALCGKYRCSLLSIQKIINQ